MARIELSGLRKRWGEDWGVRDVNLDIADQELVVLLGPSGCGKTTTMRMIAGLEEPSGGDIRMAGELVNEVDARDRDVAMVFQGYALYPNMTVYENIRFPLRMRGLPRAQHDGLVREAAELVELGDYLHRKPAALSGGQRQRAALARAIVRKPQAFLMDEPLSNLDAKLRQAMRVQIKHLQKRLAITTVYVTHDQFEAMTLADRIVIMKSGEVMQIGTPDEIYTDPANVFVAGFVGAPPMNMVPGSVSGGRFTAAGFDAPAPGLADGSAVTLGIRPEDCTVTDAGATQAHLDASVYAVEPTGDMTYLTVRTDAQGVASGSGDGLFEVRAARGFHADLDSPARIRFDTERLYFFDTDSGERIRPQQR